MTPITPQIVASFFQAINNCLMSYAHAILLFYLLWGRDMKWLTFMLIPSVLIYYKDVICWNYKKFKWRIGWKLKLCCLCHTFWVLLNSHLGENGLYLLVIVALIQLTLDRTAVSCDFALCSPALGCVHVNGLCHCTVQSYTGLCLFEWLRVQSHWLLEVGINIAVFVVWSDILQHVFWRVLIFHWLRIFSKISLSFCSRCL